jgi:hypothetical protein
MVSKGVKAFAIYFIVWAIIVFLSSFAALLYQIFLITGVFGESLYSLLPALGFLDWARTLLGVLSAFLLFFAGLFVLKTKNTAIRWVLISSSVLIIKNIVNIVRVFKQILGAEGSILASFSTYTISFYVFSILVWVFVMFFFSKESVKSQFTLSRLTPNKR